MAKDILTLKDMAEYLKLAEKTAYKLVAEGKLLGYKVGGICRFKQSDIESGVEAKKTSNKNNNEG